jgi:hypothetical protein
MEPKTYLVAYLGFRNYRIYLQTHQRGHFDCHASILILYHMRMLGLGGS